MDCNTLLAYYDIYLLTITYSVIFLTVWIYFRIHGSLERFKRRVITPSSKTISRQTKLYQFKLIILIKILVGTILICKHRIWSEQTVFIFIITRFLRFIVYVDV